ncbi:hypothetical protein RB195_026058 [Necator americanus]|uniref:Uncharacterized protein n=1 Tax=Necator americanus TaxID=51031 RepID=A0ABR1EV71_NECAM
MRSPKRLRSKPLSVGIGKEPLKTTTISGASKRSTSILTSTQLKQLKRARLRNCTDFYVVLALSYFWGNSFHLHIEISPFTKITTNYKFIEHD